MRAELVGRIVDGAQIELVGCPLAVLVPVYRPDSAEVLEYRRAPMLEARPEPIQFRLVESQG